MDHHSSDVDDSKNYELFRDTLSAVLIQRLSKPQQRTRRQRRPPAPDVTNEAADEEEDDGDLDEFIEYIASSAFACLPEELRSLTHHGWAASAAMQERYAVPLTGARAADLLSALDVSAADSLAAYSITGRDQDPTELLAPVLSSYVAAASTPPPAPISTKSQATACELCHRDYINLTYHHLIPRFVHAKAVKRGWRRPDELQNVAWLCGACHRAVHRFASHEDLARYYYTVDLLAQQDEIARFAQWAGRLRWKKK